MVNTRRTESSSVAPDNGQRYETTKSNNSGELGSSCDSINGEQEEDDSIEEDSWSSQDKANLVHLNVKKKKSSGKVRELRGRFVCDDKKFNRLHLSTRHSRVRRGIIYASRKMRNIISSDMEDVYSPKRMRSDRYATKREARMNRRAALSLRPITQKSYKDSSPALCNSEDSNGFTTVRRSARTRHSARSWIGDDQMHKIGYPTLNTYSDEEDDNEQPPRKLRRCKKYMYGYKSTSDLSANGTAAQDKENHEDSNVLRNANLHKRTSRSNTAKSCDTSSSSEPKPSSASSESNDTEKDSKRTKQTDVDDEKEESEIKSTTETQQNGNATEADCSIGPRTRFGGRKRKLSTSSSEVAVRNYSLRDRRPKALPIFTDSCRVPRRNETRRFAHGRSHFSRRQSSSDTDSTDSECRLKNSYGKATKSPHSKNEQLRTGAGNVLPIAPETLDTKITFQSVGGLKEHVQCLKEMVLLPMMYPDVFANFQMQPSRGVLFHGPPGTGKTLLARALANQCSQCSFGAKKVSFYMRKGADLLSKWIGESEKQLRLLFEQAAERKPSIIFFDELDGLAPVRSSRQDQVHASIVSTLLALMDGLTNRGEVIVIGATNRIDAIDPALRRPGRFDRELYFPLPSQSAREEILRVHLTQWSCPPNDTMISYLAENSVGYCGSDLRALCSEAVIQSFRRTYPQVYSSEQRLLLEADNVKVEKIDFLRAKSVLVPASHRVAESVGCKLTAIVQPLLERNMQEVLNILQHSFPHGFNGTLAKVKLSASLRPAQMLIAAENDEFGNTTYLAPALLHKMEHIRSHVLDLAALHCQSERSPESACVQVFREAKRNVPSIIYIPNIDMFWKLVSDTVIGIFMTQLRQIGPNTPILLLATSNTKYLLLPSNLRYIFSEYRKEVYTLGAADEASRTAFFKPLIIDACRKPPRAERGAMEEFAVLPPAPTPPESDFVSLEVEKKLYETEERTLRELRIFLRDICKKLASNRMFYLFTKPVDTEEVPDYTTIIKAPMDLETMMVKVDFHRYECGKDFLDDIDLICRNALEYNPARTSADKQIRHRACALRDYAFTMIENEMDSDFEEKCQDIAERRRVRKVSNTQFLPPYLTTSQDAPALNRKDEPEAEDTKDESVLDASIATSTSMSPAKQSPHKRRKTSKWQRGCLRKRKRAKAPEQVNGKTLSEEDSKDTGEFDGSKEETTSNENEAMEMTDSEREKRLSVKLERNDFLSPSELLDDVLDIDDIHETLNEKKDDCGEPSINIAESELNDVLNVAVALTNNKSLTLLLDVHFQLSRVIKKYMKTTERLQLSKDLLRELKRFKSAQNEIATTNSLHPSSSGSLLSQMSDHCINVFNEN